MLKKNCALFIITLAVSIGSISVFAEENVSSNNENVSSNNENTSSAKSGSSYDNKIQTIGENDKNYTEIIDIFDSIKDQASALDINASTFSNNNEAIVSEAVKAYMLDPEQFIQLLNSRDISQENFVKNGSEVWRVPVGINTQGNYVYSNAYTLADGEYDTVTIENKPGASNVEYVFDKNIVDEILTDNNLSATVLLPISVREIHSDFIFVSDSNGNTHFISFSARPDFLGLENGGVYSQEQVKAAVTDLNQRINGGIASGGGVGSSSFDFAYLIMAAILILGIAVFIVKYFIFSKKNIKEV